MNSKNIAISAENIHKAYKSTKALDGLSFTIPEALCFGFLGPNGAGKTTMMKILYGMTDRSSDYKSTINVFGFDPQTHSLEIKYISGIVPQEDNLDVELSVRENLNIYSKFYGIPKNISKSRIAELLSFMELEDKEKSRIRELSGGMKRRLTIARALLNNPRLLILDEPTTGLDPQVRHLIWSKLRGLKQQGVTILLTTHYMEEAFQLCDELIIMNQGKSVLRGEPHNLIKSNIEAYVLEIYNTSSRCFQEIQGTRHEVHQSNLYVYSDSLETLQRIGHDCSHGDYYLRQTNLEDVFLKNTGRKLDE